MKVSKVVSSCGGQHAWLNIWQEAVEHIVVVGWWRVIEALLSGIGLMGRSIDGDDTQYLGILCFAFSLCFSYRA